MHLNIRGDKKNPPLINDTVGDVVFFRYKWVFITLTPYGRNIFTNFLLPSGNSHNKISVKRWDFVMSNFSKHLKWKQSSVVCHPSPQIYILYHAWLFNKFCIYIFQILSSVTYVQVLCDGLTFHILSLVKSSLFTNIGVDIVWSYM